MNEKPFYLSVYALIADERSRSLVIRRSQTSRRNAGRWDFPGGKVDPGEAFEVALVREVVEETGLTVTLEKVLGAAELEMSDRKIAYLFMETRATTSDVRLSREHDHFAWFTTAELAASDLCPQFVDFARSLNKAD